MKSCKEEVRIRFIFCLIGLGFLFNFSHARQKSPEINVYKGGRWSIVHKEDKVGVINALTGQVVIPIEYDDYDYYEEKDDSEFYLRFYNGTKTFHAFSHRKEGKLICVGVEDMSPFGTDKFILNKKGKVFFIDNKGEFVGPNGYYTHIEYAFLKDDLYYAYRGKRCRVIDENFTIYPGHCKDYIEKEQEEEVERKLFKQVYETYPSGEQGEGYVNTQTGEMVIPCVPGQWVLCLNDSFFLLKSQSDKEEDNNYYLYDRYGNLMTETGYDDYNATWYDNYLLLKKDNTYNLFDLRTGDWFSLPYKIHYADYPFPLLVVSEKEKYGLYHLEKDSVVVPCIYDGYDVRNNANYILETAGKMGLWDGDGNNLLPAEYDEIDISPICIFKKDGLYGMMSYRNKHFFPPQFTEIHYSEDDERVIYTISDDGVRFFRFYWDAIYELGVCTYKDNFYPTWGRYAIIKEDMKEILYDCETQHILFTVENGKIFFYTEDFICIIYSDETQACLELSTGKNLIPEGYIWKDGSASGSNFIFLDLLSTENTCGIYDPGKQEWIVPGEYSEVKPAQFGLWNVCDEKGKWGIYGYERGLIVPIEYDRIDPIY